MDMETTTTTIDLSALNLTVRLGDTTLPLLEEVPAWSALMKYLNLLLGPIESGK